MTKLSALLTVDPNRLDKAREHMRYIRGIVEQLAVLRDHLAVDRVISITRALERIAGVSSPGEVLPIRIKPEVLDYDGIEQLATDIVTALPPQAEYSEYFQSLLAKIRDANPSDWKEARSQLDMIWYMVKHIVLEDD
jgi:hypothetical protein